jgi:hypothetical protein
MGPSFIVRLFDRMNACIGDAYKAEAQTKVEVRPFASASGLCGRQFVAFDGGLCEMR